jgi:2-polyprenyl-3-methyl-5-hydroxy-6-metoxy-1,4-benzoquinol methylase
MCKLLSTNNNTLATNKTDVFECAICGSKDFKYLFKSYDYLIHCHHGYDLVKCNQCGQVRINPLPNKKYLVYPLDHTDKFGRIDIFYLLLKLNKVGILERIKKGNTILDVGCGSGEFLFDMKKREWKVFGNDTSYELCAYAQKELGLENIFNKDLISLEFPDKFFDAVTLWHVLEHLNRPMETLKKINNILKDDGVLIIESPNFDSCQRKFFKEKWFALTIPRHIYHFSSQSVEKVLNRAGLKIIKRDYFVNPRIDFVTIKRSLLRYFNLEFVPDNNGINESIILLGLKRYGIIFRILRIIFELLCLVISLFLSLLNCGSCFRVYCKKKGGC